MKNKTIEALSFAAKRHIEQYDDDGRPYYIHVIEVAFMVKELGANDDVYIAALLHDILEDTDTTYEEIKEEFGKNVADLVLEVTHKKDKKRGAYFPYLHSKWATIIKLIDRAHNLSRMEKWEKTRQQHYIKKSKFWRSGMYDMIRNYQK